MKNNSDIVGGTRVFLFLRPLPSNQPSYDWKSILSTLGQNGVKIMEECSGVPEGHEHSEVIVSAVVSDYSRTPQIIKKLRTEYQLGAAFYPWVAPNEFFSSLGQLTTSDQTTSVGSTR